MQQDKRSNRPHEKTVTCAPFSLEEDPGVALHNEMIKGNKHRHILKKKQKTTSIIKDY